MKFLTDSPDGTSAFRKRYLRRRNFIFFFFLFWYNSLLNKNDYLKTNCITELPSVSNIDYTSFKTSLMAPTITKFPTTIPRGKDIFTSFFPRRQRTDFL
jgi:hypothetical protein